MFESDNPEFVIPEALFTWRLESIENASGRTRRQNELPVLAYFLSDNTNTFWPGREDQEMEVFSGKVKTMRPNSETEPDEHLRSSGYGTLEVEWDSGDPCFLSPWEVTLKDNAYETPDAPSLSEVEKRAIANALAKVESLPDVEDYFMYPVDETRYSDYRNRVELPMDFSFIKERLASGYYSNVRSVLSDVKLLRDNCLKYNGPSSLSELASDVYDSFESEVKTHVEIDEDPAHVSMSHVAADAAPAQSDSSREQRLARRQGQERSIRASRIGGSGEDGGTSLERLPLPEQRASLSRTTRRGAAVTQNVESSQHRSRGSEPDLGFRESSRTTRSSSNRAMVVDREDDSHDNSDDMPEDDESDVAESGEEYDVDEDKHDDGDYDTPEEAYGSDDSSESAPDEYISHTRQPRQASRKSSRPHTTRARAARKRKSGPAEHDETSSSDEREEGQQKLSEEEEEEESEAYPLPARRSTRLSPPESYQEEQKRSSPRRATRASLRSTPSKDDLEMNVVLARGRSSRSTRASGTRRSSWPSTLAGEILDSPRRSSRAREKKSMADLSHSDVDEDESEHEDVETKPLNSQKKRRSGKSCCVLLFFDEFILSRVV